MDLVGAQGVLKILARFKNNEITVCKAHGRWKIQT
jgi:hypothetical protein